MPQGVVAGRQAGQSGAHHMAHDIMVGNETQPRGGGAGADSDTCFRYRIHELGVQTLSVIRGHLTPVINGA